MLVLALDTTTRPGSLALVRDADVLASASGDGAKTHAERLPGAIVSLLSQAGVPLSAIDVFGVAAGPGSFTGLRIGIATIQGVAFAFDRPVVGVSCLDALALVAVEAAAGFDERPLVAAWMDAQRSEVFAALYESPPDPGGADEGLVIDGPVSEQPAGVLQRWETLTAGRPVWLAGDGVTRYRDLLTRSMGGRLHPVEALPPLAPVVGRLALGAAAHGRAVAPRAVRPIYVRRPDAELARDRRPGPAGTGPSHVD